MSYEKIATLKHCPHYHNDITESACEDCAWLQDGCKGFSDAQEILPMTKEIALSKLNQIHCDFNLESYAEMQQPYKLDLIIKLLAEIVDLLRK